MQGAIKALMAPLQGGVGYYNDITVRCEMSEIIILCEVMSVKVSCIIMQYTCLIYLLVVISHVVIRLAIYVVEV